MISFIFIYFCKNKHKLYKIVKSVNNKNMKKTNFKKHPVNLGGSLPEVGKPAPAFELVKSDLATISLEDLKGKTLVLNIFPSLDTGVCATSVRKFNQLASGMKDTLVLAISRDLPFAHTRFCTTEGIENVILCLISDVPVFQGITECSWKTVRCRDCLPVQLL